MMIAHQVAGKAARDALFLTSFSARSLPGVMAVGAALSLVAALWMSRLLARHPPSSLLTALFAMSAVGLGCEWALGLVSRPAMAIALYLHLAIIGPLTITAFWSLINERFDPYSARRAVGRIAIGGTAGGVIGALMSWRASTLVELPTLVLVLAGMHGACLIGTLFLRTRAVASGRVVEREAAVSTLGLLRHESYLRNLGLLVALVSAVSSLLDYMFSVQAVATIDRGAPLLRFFSLFWLAVAVLSLAIQLTVGQRALARLGLAANIAILPGLVIAGGVFAFAVPGFLSMSILRGSEAVQRNTLFRGAYELLYTPLSERQKRAVKAHIDIGFDRLGTIAAAGLVLVFVTLFAHASATDLLGVVIVLGILTLIVVRALHAGYVTALEHGLREGATKLELPSLALRAESAAETAEYLEREALIQRVELLRPRHDSSLPSAADGADGAESGRGAGPAAKALRAPDAVPDGRAFLGGDPVAIAAAIRALPLEKPSPVTGFLILLLAHKQLHRDAHEALCRAAPVMTGQLIDALVAPDMDFVVRRRIPSVLASCATQRAADGLLLGIADMRFEVRYACGIALRKISDTNPDIVISRQRIVQAILIEADREAPGAREPEFEFDTDGIEEASAHVDDLLARDRVDRALEYVFTLLGLHLEREPMRMAYRALRHPDVRHRGTALEYLQTILPHDLRDAIWPLVGALAPLPASRSAREILADLLRATVVQASPGRERD